MHFFIKLLLIHFTLLSIIHGASSPYPISQFQPTDKETKAGATVLEKNIYIKIDSNGQRERTNHYVIAILSEEAARDYGQIYTSFNSFYEDKKLDFARVIKTDGSVKNIQDDAVQIQNPQGYNSYDDTKLITFSLPAIKVNSIIEFQISSKSKKMIIENHNGGAIYAHYWQINSSTNRTRLDPVRKTKIIIDVANDKKLFYNGSLMQSPRITTKSDFISYQWNISNLKKTKVENSTLNPYSIILPRLTYSTMQDWRIINKYLFKKFDDASTPNQKIKTLVQNLTKNVTTDMEKIKILYNYMQSNIKYIFAHFGKGGIIPHKASEIIENLYGDCKDQTVLYIALLKSAGIKAYPSLVNTYPSQIAEKDVPSSNYFNHVLVYIPKENVWIDTTGYNSVYPGLSWSVNQKRSLILNGHDSDLKLIHVNDTQNIKVDFESTIEDDKLIGKVHFKPDSFVSNFYKSFITNSQDAHTQIKNDFAKFYPNSKMIQFDFLHVDTPTQCFEIKYKFEIPLNDQNRQEIQSYNSMLGALVAMSLPIISLETPSQRVYGFRYGYKVEIDLTSKFIAPNESFRSTFQKLPSSFNSTYYDYSFSHKVASDSVTTHEVFKLNQNKIKRDQYYNFYRKSKQIFNDISWVLQFKKDLSRKKELDLKEDLIANHSPEKRIELVEHYLNVVNYDDAKIEIEKLLVSDPQNAKAHYLHGIVLGYLDDFDQSDIEFKRAKELGYRE